VSYDIGHEPHLLLPLETFAPDPVCEQCDKYAERRHDGLCDRCAGMCEHCGLNEAVARHDDGECVCIDCAANWDHPQYFVEIRTGVRFEGDDE